MGKFAQITWPQEYSELQRIEELLLCGICYEYMETSVMTPCSHNYCSLCIRKYLHYKTQCPACFEKTFEKDLHTNRILDEIVSYFGKIREKLAQCIAGAKISAGKEHCDESVDESTRSTPVRPARTNQSAKKASPKVATKRDEALAGDVTKSENVGTFVAEQQKALASPSTSGVSKISTFFTPKSKKNLVNAATSGKTVPCPVCAVDVSELHINKHLDACLKRQTATQQAARNPEPKRKPLPKLVFSLMKDAELRKKMRELGLPSQGDRKTLETRFHRYSILYNAECDKRDPRPIEELLKQCENEENLEKKMQKFAQAANRLKITRNCEQNVIEEAQKKYLESNRQNYSDLITAIKERGKTRKAPVRRSLMIDPEVDGRADGTFASEPARNDSRNNSTGNEEDPVCYSVNSYEATFHDSDSNSSCPLQHYTSNDPTNFLSFKMTTFEGSVSPTKNLPETSACQSATLSNVHGAKPSRGKVSRTADVYQATTDDETSDEDVVPPSPDATTSRTTKRAKLTSAQLQSVDNPPEHDRLEGHKLAMSIARDFTFDTSSNDSIGNEAANETVNKKPGESAVEDHERVDPHITKLDKENEESPSPTRIRPSVVNRPLRKRKCLARLANVDTADQTRSNVRKAPASTTTERNDDETRRTNGAVEVEKLSGSRLDSPLKRRRGRKKASNEVETDPPRRPLRKRLVNSTSADNAHK